MRDIKFESINFLKSKIEKLDETPGENGSKWKRLESMFRKKKFEPTIMSKLQVTKEEESIQKPLNSNADAVATNSTAEQAENRLYLNDGL